MSTGAMKVVLVVPTYNERDNIARLIDALRTVFTRIEYCEATGVVYVRCPVGVGFGSFAGWYECAKSGVLEFSWLMASPSTSKRYA